MYRFEKLGNCVDLVLMGLTGRKRVGTVASIMPRAFKFWLILLLLVVFGVGIYFIVRDRQGARDLAGWKQFQKNLEVYKNDTYGGKTPEETLKMFVDALKEGDVEKAALYFTLDDNGSRERWVNDLLEDQKNGNLEKIIKGFSNTIALISDDKNLQRYKVLNPDRTVWLFIEFIYNGNVCKIVSL